MGARKTIALSAWGLLLFLICFGLGYPTLNRYNPSSIPGLSDSVQYYGLVEYGPAAATGHWKYRVLVPYLAKPIYWAARGRLGTWNPVSFALLAVNSLFCGCAAWFVSALAYRLSGGVPTSIVAAFAYLLNFAVPNYHLSALVDSADAFLFVLLSFALLSGKWALLPVIGFVAGFSKETFIPIGFVFAATWVLSERSADRMKRTLAVVVMAVLGMIVVLFVRSVIDHALVLPWDIVSEERSPSGWSAHNLLSAETGWNFWLTIVWLPFVFLAAKRVPKPWRRAALAGTIATIALSAWNNAPRGNTARPVFDVLGPLFAVSFALTAELAQRSAVWSSALDGPKGKPRLDG